MTVVSIAPVVHPLDDDRGLEQVAAELREDDALRRLADLVPGAADPLQPGRRRSAAISTRTTRSTAPMSMPSSSDDVATSAGMRPAFRSSSIWRRCSRAMRAVMRADELLAGELVEPLGQPLREPAAVREDDRAAVLPDQLEQARVDRRPDARSHVAERDRAARLLVGRQHLAEAGHVLDRARSPASSSALRLPASTISTSRPGPIPPRNRAIVSSGRWVADRPIRCIGGASAARRRSSRSSDSARCAPRFVPAIAWTSSRIDRLDAPQRLARARSSAAGTGSPAS